VSALAFNLPRWLEAHEPPEARGIARDGVRLLVADSVSGAVAHHSFRDLPELLSPGDLLVVNVSATLRAAVGARRAGGRRVRLHVSTRVPRQGPSWRVVELRTEDGAHPLRGCAEERLELDGGAAVKLVAPYASGTRLWVARFETVGTVEEQLVRHGSPIHYGYVRDSWPLESYQNVYATTPGSAEMPSAGRPFTHELITRLVARGVHLAPITLHTGVSSPERHEPPYPEQFEVPESTAVLIDAVRESEGRVIAVGTTVVRALETAAHDDRTVRPCDGWTSLVIGRERGVSVVDGLITGWHEPEASHLQMLEAIAGHELLERSYDAALERGYLWHEFGDSHLIL
jgi:S-adenosylmethionine:tRNA ribosyltransferase-isomerase